MRFSSTLLLIHLILTSSFSLFSQERQYTLAGEWDFYWNELIVNPKEAVYPPNKVKTPGDWYIDSSIPDIERHGYATYFRRVTIENDGTLGLKISHAFSSYHLFINDISIYESGKVAKSRSAYRPYREPKVIAIPKSLGDSLAITIQVANYDHSNSGIYYEISIADYNSLNIDLQRRQAVSLFLAGGLFLTGFILLGFSLASHQLELQVLFFALFALSLVYRMLGATPYPLHTLEPGLNFYLAIRMEYLSVHTAALFGGLFIFQTFKNQTPHLLAKIFYCGTAISTFIVIFLKPVIFTSTLQYYLFFIIFYVGVFIYIVVQARIKKEPNSDYLLGAIGAIFIWTLFQIITFLNIGKIPFVLNVLMVSIIVVLCNVALFQTFLKRVYRANKQQSAFDLAQSKNSLLSLISHEIKMPVASLQMNLMMLKEVKEDDALLLKIKDKTIDKATSAIDSIKSMLNDFLFFMSFESKIEKEWISAGILKNLIEDRFDVAFINKENIEISFRSHKVTLSYILKTLIGNAFKHTKNSLKAPEIYFSHFSHFVVIEVRDYGGGISEEALSSIGRTRRRVTELQEVEGMGFYLAKDLSKRLDHKLSIEKNNFGGTSVYIQILVDD